LTPASFKAWRERLYGPRSFRIAADALGCSRTSIRAWEAGTHKIPLYIALACQALANGLPPMSYGNQNIRRSVPQVLRGQCPDCGAWNIPEKGFWDAGAIQPYCPTCKDFVFATFEEVRKTSRFTAGSNERGSETMGIDGDEPQNVVPPAERNEMNDPTNFTDPCPRFSGEIRVGDKVTSSGVGEPREMVVTAVTGRYKAGRTAAAMKPWEAKGISRRTWYRRQKESKPSSSPQ
jgi:hypothetical protein